MPADQNLIVGGQGHRADEFSAGEYIDARTGTKGGIERTIKVQPGQTMNGISVIAVRVG